MLEKNLRESPRHPGRAKGVGGAFARPQGPAARSRSREQAASLFAHVPRSLAPPATSPRCTPPLRFVPADPVARVAQFVARGNGKDRVRSPGQVASPERAAPQPVRQLHHVCSERRGDLSIRTVKAHLLVLHILHGAHHPRAPWPLPVVCASLKGRGPLRSADPPVACNGRVVGQSRLNYRRLIPAATRNGA